MCLLSRNITVGIGTEEDCNDWLIILVGSGRSSLALWPFGALGTVVLSLPCSSVPFCEMLSLSVAASGPSFLADLRRTCFSKVTLRTPMYLEEN